MTYEIMWEPVLRYRHNGATFRNGAMVKTDDRQFFDSHNPDLDLVGWLRHVVEIEETP